MLLYKNYRNLTYLTTPSVLFARCLTGYARWEVPSRRRQRPTCNKQFFLQFAWGVDENSCLFPRNHSCWKIKKIMIPANWLKSLWVLPRADTGTGPVSPVGTEAPSPWKLSGGITLPPCGFGPYPPAPDRDAHDGGSGSLPHDRRLHQ